MTKSDLIDRLQRALGGATTKRDAQALVAATLDIVRETLARREAVKLTRFGTFSVSRKRQRLGRNPRTGEPIGISARYVVSFRASQLLKQALGSS